MKMTKADIKGSIVTVVFYIVIIGILFIAQQLDEQASNTYELGYRYASVYIKGFGFLLLGGLIAFLGRRPKDNKKTIILDLLVIGIPSLLMINNLTLYYRIPLPLPFIGQNSSDIALIGAILLGCEIYRNICWFRKNKIQKG